MELGKICFSGDFEVELEIILRRKSYDKVFVLTDTNVDHYYGRFIMRMLKRYPTQKIVITAGDEHKNIDSLSDIWSFLSDAGASRHSCMINFGGGMITDIGGFAASTFKRGIDFINIPTTLLAMIDASSGGKTAINFNGLKNEIGAFAQPTAVIVHKAFINTLNITDILSGYAEMLKHALINNEEMWRDILTYDLNNRSTFKFMDMIRNSARVKEHIVNDDPKEMNIRKILNFGHTFGHAFEELSLSWNRPLLHGYAVAYGMVCELYLSSVLKGFPTDKMRQTVRFINEKYGKFAITCNDYDGLLELMRHDKKNSNGNINFALLEDIGCPVLDCHATKDDIFEAFDFLREGM